MEFGELVFGVRSNAKDLETEDDGRTSGVFVDVAYRVGRDGERTVYFGDSISDLVFQAW